MKNQKAVRRKFSITETINMTSSRRDVINDDVNLWVINNYALACICLDRISKIFKRVSGSWRLSSKTRGRLLSQRRKYKNAHKYTNGNKSRISQNGILSGFDYDAFINAFESLATGLNQDRTGIGRKDHGILTIFDQEWPFLTIFWIWPFYEFDHF